MGEFKVDPATIAFRLALAEASEQEQARADALLAFWQRPILAATWPTANEAPRTLTNSQGETALPLFTGLDTLELGADRFSWREPNGSIRFREMSASEALRYALARQVNFVVVDVGFEHNVEFAREEFESLVLQKDAQASREQAAARTPSPSAAATSKAPSPSAQPSSAARQQVSAASPTPPAVTTPQPQAAASVTQPAQTSSSQSSQPPRQRAESGQYGAAASSTPRAAASQSPQPQRQANQHGGASAQSAPQRSDQAPGAPAQNPQSPRDRSEPGQYAQTAAAQSADHTPSQNAQSPRHRSEPGQYSQTAAAQSSRNQSQSPQAPRHRSEPGQYAQAAGIAGSSRPPVYAQGAVSQTSQPGRPRSDQPAHMPSAAPTPLRAAARAIPQQSARTPEPTRARGSSSAPPSDAMAPKHPSSVPPNLPLGPPIHDVQVSPRLQSGAVPIQQPIHPPVQQEATPRQRSGAVPIQPPPSVRPEALDPEPQPQAPATPPPLDNSSARSQRSISVPPKRRTLSASPPPPSAYPPHPSETASTIPPQQKDERPTAAPPPRAAAAQGQTHPQASFVPRPHSPTAPIHTPKAPTPAPQSAPPRAAGELRRTPPPVPEAAKSKSPSTPGTPAPISDAPFSARPANDNKLPDMKRRARDDEPTLAERPNRANTQRGLQASVPDTALEALSSELRGFPEVEWACVLVDESDVPLIGVRVDPSFLNRVADITDVILDTGERQSVTLQVLLLNNQDQVKNARRNGRAFYPWTTTTR